MSATADLCDAFVGDVASAASCADVRVLPPGLRDFAGRACFSGRAHTVRCRECNTLVRKALEGPGEGRVLCVDGGGSTRCALVGDNLAELGAKNGWAGIIVDGLIRDSAPISGMQLGLKALGTHPLKSDKAAADQGQAGEGASLLGVAVAEGDWVYADPDGVLVSKRELVLPS